MTVPKRNITMGSLFDGIGGFPFAAIRAGITPIWASEIEKAPISITKRHFPEMLHLGDITALSGADMEPVDLITFGSPCQDLSIAGNMAGLSGKRSGLFMEAVRIIKEMRDATNGARPAFAIWENVTGAFSSNEGEDFRIVLEELAAITEQGISIPRCPSKDGWLSAGAVMGDGWSLAWRTLDAQYWGVPQRRRRIFLVADFRGQCAGEVLFKPESLPGDNAESGTEGERAADDAERGTGTAIGFDGYNQNLTGGVVQTLRGERADGDHQGMVVIPINTQENHSHTVAIWPEVVGSLVARADGSPCIDRGQPFVYDARGNGDGQLAPTMTGDHNGRVSDYTALAVHQNQCGDLLVAPTLGHYNSKFGCNQFVDQWGDFFSHYSVRRLTPMECERLQGFPDGWTEYGMENGLLVHISDSQRYKALGNSVAIPCVVFLMTRILAVINRLINEALYE